METSVGRRIGDLRSGMRRRLTARAAFCSIHPSSCAWARTAETAVRSRRIVALEVPCSLRALIISRKLAASMRSSILSSRNGPHCLRLTR